VLLTCGNAAHQNKVMDRPDELELWPD